MARFPHRCANASKAGYDTLQFVRHTCPTAGFQMRSALSDDPPPHRLAWWLARLAPLVLAPERSLRRWPPELAWGRAKLEDLPLSFRPPGS